MDQQLINKYRIQCFSHFFLPNRLLAKLSFFSSIGLLLLFFPSLGPRKLNYFFFSPFRSCFTISYSVSQKSRFCSVLFISFLFFGSPHLDPGLNSKTFLNEPKSTICFELFTVRSNFTFSWTHKATLWFFCLIISILI